MSWSPSQAASLPSKVAQSSPTAASGSRHVPLTSSSPKNGRNAANPALHDSDTRTRSPPRTVPSRPLMPKHPQQHVRALRYGPSSTAPAAIEPPNNSRPVPGKSSQRRSQLVQSRKAYPTGGGSSGNRTSAKTELSDHSKTADDDHSFSRFTDEEPRTLKRKHCKEPTYSGFKDARTASELDCLDRGWEGHGRASLNPGQEGRPDAQPEGRLISAGVPLPARAMSMQAAVGAADRESEATMGQVDELSSQDNAMVNEARKSSMQAVGSHRGLMAAQVTSPFATGHHSDESLCDFICEQPAPSSNSKPLDPDTAKTGVVQYNTTSVHQLPESTQTSESDYQPRHRGRPKGSKNKTISSSTLVDRSRPRRVETRPDYRIRCIRERHPDTPRRPLSPSPRDLYDSSRPEFLQFKCEWVSCKATLNNAATLRKHVTVVHGQEAREALCCSWGKCGRDGSTGMLSTFRSIGELVEHFEALHMEPVNWHLGDGRLGQGLVLKTQHPLSDTSYLYRNGKQVTPSVMKQKLETLAEWRMRKNKLKEMLLKAALNAPSDFEDNEDGEAVERVNRSPL